MWVCIIKELSGKNEEDYIMGAFQEWLLQNPIGDWLWEIFKGLSPFIIALITIGINNKRTRENDKKKLKLELKRESLKEVQEKFFELYELVYNLQELLNGILMKNNFAERKEMHSEFFEMKLKMMNRVIFLHEFESCICNTMEVDMDLKALRHIVAEYNKNLTSVFNKYVGLPETEESLNEINSIVIPVREALIDRQKTISECLSSMMK